MTRTILPARLQSIFIHYHEGNGQYNNHTFATWSATQRAMVQIARDHVGESYTKVKMTITWTNGGTITDRIDISPKDWDFWPLRETLAEYLKRQQISEYVSNVTSDQRAALMFEDTPATPYPIPSIEVRTFEEIIQMQADTYLLN